MAAELWLQEERTVLDEPGAGLVYDFGPRQRAAVLEALARGELELTGAIYEPVGGHFAGRPLEQMDDCALADWTADEPDHWIEARPFAQAGGSYAKALYHTADAAWTLTENGEASWGEPRYLAFVTYPSPDAGGTGETLTVEFGGVWRLTLHAAGTAQLAERLGAGDSAAWVHRSEFEWRTAERFAAPGGVVHWLWIYEVGPKLVIRNVAAAADGRLAGCVLFDSGAQLDPLNPLADVPHALRPGRWRLACSGRITLGVSRARYVTGTSVVARPVPTSIGLAGSSWPVRWRLDGLSSALGVSPAVIVRDDAGALWPTTGGPFGTPLDGLQWQVQWATTSTATFFLSGAAFVLSRSLRSDGAEGTDLLALEQVAGREVTLARELDGTRERLAARLFTSAAELAGYVQPNMSLRYEVDGTTLFRGLTERAEWQALIDGDEACGWLVLDAQGLWKRFRRAVWPGGEPFDGRQLVDVLAELAASAGLGDDDVELPSWDYVLPSPPHGAAPSLAYRPGTPIERILEDLRNKFFGDAVTLGFRLSDGKFVVELTSLGASVATFYARAADAAAAGFPGRVVLAGSYQETLDESALANVVTVIGQAPDGRPLTARAIDWGSLRDPAAANYIGEPWPLTVVDPGLATPAAVSWACARIFARRRWPRVLARWQSVRLNLVPGQVVTLDGEQFGGSYRLEATAATDAADSDPAGRCWYAAEKLP